MPRYDIQACNNNNNNKQLFYNHYSTTTRFNNRFTGEINHSVSSIAIWLLSGAASDFAVRYSKYRGPKLKIYVKT